MEGSQPRKDRGAIRRDGDLDGTGTAGTDLVSGPTYSSRTEPPRSAWRHRIAMLACCLPMLILVVALAVSGAGGGGALLFGLLCTSIMAVMMFAMSGPHRH